MSPPLKIAVVSPSATFDQANLERAHGRALALGFSISSSTKARSASPAFLNGSVKERLAELSAAEFSAADAIWCARGGCGAVSLWPHYHGDIYKRSEKTLVGYSDVTALHLARFIRASRIGIHGLVFLDLIARDPIHVEPLVMLLNRRAQDVAYPILKKLNFTPHDSIEGELVVMNLATLQSLLGCFDHNFFRGKILAIEDVNEPHYKIYRALNHMRNVGILSGLRALVLGYFGDDRSAMIEHSALPLAQELGIPLFDWPIFGHSSPNWPLLFGAKASIARIDDQIYALRYREQLDHTLIPHE